MRTKILIIMLTVLSSCLLAQGDDTLLISRDSINPDTMPRAISLLGINVDSTIEKTPKKRFKLGHKLKGIPLNIKNFFNDENPKPKKALWMTFVLPGSGQAYNNKHWKIPIVYAGVGALSYIIASNTRNYKRYKTAYIYRLDGDESTIEESNTVNLSNASLQNVRDGYRNNLERSYMGLIGFYALVGIDAFVDAHLQNFDISDELSWQLKPSFQNQSFSRNPSTGMTFGLTFGYRKSNVLELSEAFERVGDLSPLEDNNQNK